MKQHKIITLSRQYGSGGRQVGIKLSERLKIPFYDREIIMLAAAESGIAQAHFEQAEERTNRSIPYDMPLGMLYELPLSDKIFIAQSNAIRKFADLGPCVMVGRCANDILRENKNVLSVFIYADIEYRKKCAVRDYGDPSQKIEDYIESIDKKRRSYYNYYAHTKFGRPEAYHLCLDSGYLGIDTVAKLIETAYNSL